MAEIKVSFPDDLKSKIEKHPEIDWSMLFKKAAIKMLHRISLLEFIENKLEKSEFTEQDAIELSEKIKEKRLKELKSKKIL